MGIELKESNHEPKKKLQTGNKAMLCPHCQVPLGMSDRQGIEIDFCPQCRGVWLDRGELDKIIKRTATKSSIPQNQDFRADDDRGHTDRRKSWLHELFD
ncbi:hypothetical protein LCGC14_1349390 [marine sediment metagenome]|uniref:Transcription factor zinc-finger domain-containing protein n=1 Tax=marine sediment metagenome TaxID=412755 RepID=A0A0F9NDM8_9ZZZZ|nr:zf-TFIIB domain-containing protein [Marinobacter sp. AC-23]